MFAALTTTNLSYGMKSEEAKASKEDIMPALEKSREPEIQKVPQILVKNNTKIDAFLTLSYEIKDKNAMRTVQTFLDARQTMPIPVSMGSYDLTGIQAKLMYMGQAAFEPLQLTTVQKALLTANEAYVSLEEIDDKLVINVRRYQQKSAKQKAVQPSGGKKAQQVWVEPKREAAVPAVAGSAPSGPGIPIGK
jgi:hypothetical protein